MRENGARRKLRAVFHIRQAALNQAPGPDRGDERFNPFDVMRPARANDRYAILPPDQETRWMPRWVIEGPAAAATHELDMGMALARSPPKQPKLPVEYHSVP